ncbi:PBSX family phage terminase large subunit [Taklimakanibacter deserti]|uniref:PBSX family phage terminase large subunit n=1 Tax=Taklimakanibacter deserti TaxID=2267839 RepID=UPI0013C4D91A
MIRKLDVPRAFLPLLTSRRYKGAYGGRGGAKSHFFAGQLVLLCARVKTRAVCIREVQNSIKESVRQLVVDKIAYYGLGARFTILESEIRGKNGSLVIFKGMQSYNAENIKSLEDYDIAWVEEAQSLSNKSLRLLRPTIRKQGSEIWFSWNPRHETDAVDKFFRGGKPRDDAVIVAVNWNDNPWFPDVLRQEKESDYAADPEMAAHVWGGGYEHVSEASYYGRLIAQAEKDAQIGHFPHDPARPVKTAWDIGIDDYTSIWFFQDDGLWATAIDYYETSGLGAEDIVREALPELDPDLAEGFRQRREIGREAPFRYGEHFLPHDVRNREWGAGGRTRALTLMRLGVKPIHIGAALGPVERINAARALLPRMRFNRTTRVMLGVSRLRRYSRRFNERMQTFGVPLHDENSHGADAFGEFAVNCGLVVPKTVEKPKPWPGGTVFLPGAPEPSASKRMVI